MFSTFLCLQIVVGTPSKSLSQGLFPTLLPELMDSREGCACSDDVFKPRSHLEPTRETRKAIPELLPGVHNAHNASSPVSSYRSMFETWEEQRRKLYQYSSSQIEVIVERKNGLIEKLHSHNKNILKKNKTFHTSGIVSESIIDDDEKETSKIYSSTDETILDDEAHLTSESEINCKADLLPSNTRDDKDIGRLLNDKSYGLVSEELNVVVPLGNELQIQQPPSPYKEIMEYTTESPCRETLGSPKDSTINEQLTLSSVYPDATVILTQTESHHNNYNDEPNCKFIFKIKTRYSTTFLLDRKENIIKSNSTSIQPSYLHHTCTEENAIQAHDVYTDQVYKNEQIMTRMKDCASQCIGGEHITISSQTTDSPQVPVAVVNIGIQTNEPDQRTRVEYYTLPTQTDEIQKYVADSGVQTDKPEQLIAVKYATMSTQTDGVQVPFVDFGIQTEEPEMLKSVTTTSTQIDGLLVQLSTATKECQADCKVPCCDATSQTDGIPIKEDSCQAVSEMTSTSSQTQLEVQTSDKAIETTVPSPLEVQDVGVQLTASCCYFARKRERKRYHKRLRQFFPQHFEKDKINDGKIEEKSLESETSLSDSINSLTLERLEAIELVKNCQSIRAELEELEIAQESGIDTLVSNATQRLERRNLESLEEDDLFLS